MEAIGTIPILRKAPQRWIEFVESEGGTRAIAIGFWIIVVAGVAAAPLIGRGVRSLFDHRAPVVTEPGLRPRLKAAGIRLLISLTTLALYGFPFWAALFWVSAGAPILEHAADQVVWAALKWRLLIIALVIIVSPYRPDLRLLAIDDPSARICSRWIAVYLALTPLDVFLVWLAERLAFDHAAVFGAAFVLGLLVTAYKAAMLWAIRKPIASAIVTVTCGHPSPFRQTRSRNLGTGFLSG